MLVTLRLPGLRYHALCRLDKRGAIRLMQVETMTTEQHQETSAQRAGVNSSRRQRR